MKVGGLILDDSPHYVDHIAPLCSCMGWPILVSEPHIADLCSRYYPELEVLGISLFGFRDWPSVLVTCTPNAGLRYALPWLPRSTRMIWLPHGQSDKGWKYPYFESLRDEDLLLVYGSRMRVVLAAKHVAIPTLAIGSYRLEYARQHARFYEPLVESLVGSERFLLYAPTWQDPEGNGTLWPTLAYLETAPRSVYRCAIRPHPNSIALDPASWERWKGRSGASFLILDNFPPVYPVLSRCEAYIGDCSSIGYDFLHFDRPLFFIGQNPFQPATGPSSYLMQAGTQIQTTDILHLLSSFTPQDYKNPRRKELLAEAFQADTDWQNQLRKFVE